VFGPIVFVRGLAAALFRDLSISVVASLGASLVLALTLLPVMLAGKRAAKGGASPAPAKAAPAKLSRWGHRFAEWYEDGMRWSLAHPRAVFGISALSLLATIGILGRLPREILPQVDEGTVV